jgi:hypothetical protein
MPRGGLRDELAEATAYGDVYLRQLRRAQLHLALLTSTLVAGTIGALPLIILLVPGLHRTHVLGIPLSMLVIMVPPFPFFVGVAILHKRRADALDAAFRALVDSEGR